MSGPMTEDRLVQATTAAYFRDVLGWDSVYAYNDEVLGPNGTLGRLNDGEVVLTRDLRAALEELNPGLTADVYDEAVRCIVETSAVKSLIQINREKYDLYRKGVPVTVKRPDGAVEELRLRVFDFQEPTHNHFLVVRELWVAGYPYRRRPDILGFVNGIPLLFIELKNVHKDIRNAYDKNLADYRDTIPHLFDHNALILLSNGQRARVGTLTSQYGHFHEWKRLAEDQPGAVDLETALKGLCSKANFMDIFENFLLFDDSSGKTVKIMARNHQFLGVNRAVEAVRNRESLAGKLGVFWHTQGSGKSYSMVFFSEKVRRKLTGNFTFLVVTDREDLEKQIYNTYVGVGAVNPKEPCRAGDGDHLQRLFAEDHAYVFTLIHKFNKPVDPAAPYSPRNDIIVISDEAHRTQYGRLAINMRAALPRAHYIGFTGTPLFKDDEITKRLFGDYVSTYDFQRAVDDQATVPLYYDNRGDKLGLATPDLNLRIAEVLEQTDLDPDQERKVRRLLRQDYRVFTGQRRLNRIAQDFVYHYTAQWETGKAMLVCLDKVTCVRMYDLVQKHWQRRIKEAEKAVKARAGRPGAGPTRLPVELAARDRDRGRHQRGTERGCPVSEVRPGHRAAPRQDQERLRDRRRQADRHRPGVQGSRSPVPGRDRLRHVVDRLRRAQPLQPLPGQAAESPHPDAGHRPRQPGLPGQGKRPDRGLLRHPRGAARGAGNLCDPA